MLEVGGVLSKVMVNESLLSVKFESVPSLEGPTLAGTATSRARTCTRYCRPTTRTPLSPVTVADQLPAEPESAANQPALPSRLKVSAPELSQYKLVTRSMILSSTPFPGEMGPSPAETPGPS